MWAQEALFAREPMSDFGVEVPKENNLAQSSVLLRVGVEGDNVGNINVVVKYGLTIFVDLPIFSPGRFPSFAAGAPA